jgi:SET domain-containing protein
MMAHEHAMSRTLPQHVSPNVREALMTLVRVGASPIDRQGLFAATDIPRGTRIVEYCGEKISKAESARRLAQYNVYIAHLNEQYDIDGETPANTARYINHSCDPNCTVEYTTEALWIVALKHIRAGEELSCNYGYDAREYDKFPCRCGAAICCGYIVGREYWGLLPALSPSALLSAEEASTSPDT